MKKFKYFPTTCLGPKLCEMDLDKLEQVLIKKLPDDYRLFLLEHNGGCLDANYDYIVTFETSGDNQSVLDAFLNLTYNCFDSDDIYELWNSTYKGRMPSHFLPIARDPGGNIYCLSLGENDYGWVYFWDHEREVFPADYSNSYKISENFTSFID